MWRRATKLIAVSENERKIMSKIKQDVKIVSNGVDTEKFKLAANDKRQTTSDKRILFIGEFKWVQNRDAIKFILREIWSKLQAEIIPQMNGKGIKLWVVGKNIPDSIRKLTRDRNVIFDDKAPKETELIYQQSDVVLTPIRVGGGTSYKILEGMASGVPVVTTSLGNAMGAKENFEILIADKSEDFVGIIKKLFEDREFYNTISINARKLVEEKFNWGKIANDLNSVYESVVSL